jgi:hypothetical protein
MQGFIKFLSIMMIISTMIGGLYFLLTFAIAKSAPQEAAGFAGALSFAVIPYCLLRGFEIFSKTGNGA